MTDHEPPLTLSFGAILRIGIPVSILWIIGDAIDGGSRSFIGVPLLVAAWLGVFVALDRWAAGIGLGSDPFGVASPSRAGVRCRQILRAARRRNVSPSATALDGRTHGRAADCKTL